MEWLGGQAQSSGRSRNYREWPVDPGTSKDPWSETQSLGIQDYTLSEASSREDPSFSSSLSLEKDKWEAGPPRHERIPVSTGPFPTGILLKIIFLTKHFWGFVRRRWANPC